MARRDDDTDRYWKSDIDKSRGAGEKPLTESAGFVGDMVRGNTRWMEGAEKRDKYKHMYFSMS